MKLSEAIAQLKETEGRYAREIETGFYASGNLLPVKMIAKRQQSLRRVRERLAIAERWAKSPPRAAVLTAEREFVAEYELENIFAVVQ